MVAKRVVPPSQLARTFFGRSDRRSSTAVLDFLELVAAFPDPSGLAFDARRQPLLPWGESFASTAARAGFALVTSSPVSLRCVACGASLHVDNPEAVSAGDFQHAPECQYQHLQSLSSTESPSAASNKPSLRARRLKTHLREQLRLAKAQVASEFGFPPDAVCTEMAKFFLQTGEGFKNAGDLVDKLTDFMLAGGNHCSPIIDGVADIVTQKTPSPEIVRRGSSRAALLAETSELLARTFCYVCRTRPLQLVLLPCSHFALCETCRPGSSQCPICQEPISAVIRTYKS